jgi:transcriptional regulator with XRE-family HTH domain
MNRLREVRILARVTQFKLRVQTGINESKISHIENGLVQPREDEAKKLAKALGVKPGQLFGKGMKRACKECLSKATSGEKHEV